MTLLSTAAAIGATLVAGFAFGQAFGPELETEIEIAASPQAVWQTLADTAAYGEWNPFVRGFEGELVPGGRIAVTLQSGEDSTMAFSPRVLVAEAGAELRWLGTLGVRGIFDGEHYFVLEETAAGTTVLHHGESFRGILGYPVMALIGADTKAGFEAMNAALKARVEGAA